MDAAKYNVCINEKKLTLVAYKPLDIFFVGFRLEFTIKIQFCGWGRWDGRSLLINGTLKSRCTEDLSHSKGSFPILP